MANRLKVAKVLSIKTLHAQGWSQRRIAQELGVSRGAVARHLQAHSGSQSVGEPPDDSNRAKAPTGSATPATEPNRAKAPPGSRSLLLTSYFRYHFVYSAQASNTAFVACFNTLWLRSCSKIEPTTVTSKQCRATSNWQQLYS